jgi:hypothetical protein
MNIFDAYEPYTFKEFQRELSEYLDQDITLLTFKKIKHFEDGGYVESDLAGTFVDDEGRQGRFTARHVGQAVSLVSWEREGVEHDYKIEDDQLENLIITYEGSK